MAQPGDVIENPVTGERMVFRQTPAESDEQVLSLEYFAAPHQRPLAHMHPEVEERIQVVSGTWRFRLRGEHERSLTPGQVVVAPPGMPHSLWNSGDQEGQVVAEFRPALRLATFFE